MVRKQNRIRTIFLAFLLVIVLIPGVLVFSSRIHAANTTTTASQTTGFPWTSDCDGKTLVYTWYGVSGGLQVCGPGGVGKSETFGGGAGVNQFECVELVMRYMWLKFGYRSLDGAGGNSIVDAYTSAHPDKLHRIYNDNRMATMKIMPQEGDVISFNPGGSSGYHSPGHTAIVWNVTNVNMTTGNETFQLLEQNWGNTNPTGSTTRSLTVTNWKIDDVVADWMTTRYSPGYPGGWWTDHTNDQNPSTNVTLSFHAARNGSDGVSYVNFTMYTPSSGKWVVVRKAPAGDGSVVSISLTLREPTIIGSDVYSPSGNFQLSPSGPRRLCLGGNCAPIANIAYEANNGSNIGGGGDSTPTPTPTDGFTVCQNTNYSQPCETFHYTSHDTCIGLDQMAGHNRSVVDINNAYSGVMYHDGNCQTYLARYDTSNPDIGSGLYDQFSSMRLEQHLAPSATQVIPGNGTVLPAGTTTLGLTFQNGRIFTVHVWDLTTHYDVWQGNINATWLTINGLQNGATYNWQVQGTDEYGAGSWSDIWTFSVASNAAQVSPANGAVLAAGTTETDVSFTGAVPFTLHVWGPSYDMWQGNIAATSYHLTGLKDGVSYNWQVIGSSGVWSDTWTFSVASAEVTLTPTPQPTQAPLPTPTPTRQPTPRPTPTPVQQKGFVILNIIPQICQVTLGFQWSEGKPDSFILKRNGQQIAKVSGSDTSYIDAFAGWSGGDLTYEVDAIVGGKVIATATDSNTLDAC